MMREGSAAARQEPVRGMRYPREHGAPAHGARREVPMRRATNHRLLLLLGLLLAWLPAAALELPDEADLLVTDPSGLIVGVGRIAADTGFVLDLLAGYAGPGLLTLVTPDGATSTIEIVIGEGVMVEDVDLLEALEGRFALLEIRFVAVDARTRAPAPGPAAGVGREAPAGAAAAGRGRSDEAPGRAEDARPGPAPEPPVELPDEVPEERPRGRR